MKFNLLSTLLVGASAHKLAQHSRIRNHQDYDQYLDDNTLVESSDFHQSLANDVAGQDQKQMDDDFWVNASPLEMAQHISMNPKLTNFAEERVSGTTDKMTNRYMDQLDTLDPNLSQDMTSEYMNVQKTQSMIQKLEKKCDMEKVGFEHIQDYEQDKMMLEHHKA